MNDSQKPRLSLAAGYHLRARPLCDGRIKMKDFELEAVPFENDGEGHGTNQLILFGVASG